MPAEFTGLLPSSKKPYTVPFDLTTFFIKDAFTLRTLLLLGALLQLALFTLLPYRVALTPPIALLLYTLLSTAAHTATGPANPSMADVIPGRTSAQLAHPNSARFGASPAARPLVVFHFGVRFNHPLGMLGPGARETVAHFQACNAAAEAHRDEYGLLGTSTWRGGERGSNNALMIAYYFRDVDALNAFAHGAVHRAAWDWIVAAGHTHIGFFHEAFCVPARAYESIYVNCQPMLMGAASVQCTDPEDGEQKWVPSLVGADVGPLRSQFGRMGRAAKENESRAVE